MPKLLFVFPVKKNKIIFENFCGKGYYGNPKYICEYFINNYCKDNKIDLVWVLSDMNLDLPKQVRKVPYGKWRSMFEYATAKVWVDNVKNSYRPYCKKKNQYYLQTWHGLFPFKFFY